MTEFWPAVLMVTIVAAMPESPTPTLSTRAERQSFQKTTARNKTTAHKSTVTAVERAVLRLVFEYIL